MLTDFLSLNFEHWQKSFLTIANMSDASGSTLPLKSLCSLTISCCSDSDTPETFRLGVSTKHIV